MTAPVVAVFVGGPLDGERRQLEAPAPPKYRVVQPVGGWLKPGTEPDAEVETSELVYVRRGRPRGGLAWRYVFEPDVDEASS